MSNFKSWLPAAAMSVAACLAPAAAQQVDTSAGWLALTSLVALDNPWAIARLPDGSALITEKPGRLRLFKDGQLSGPIAGVPDVAYLDQGGLLDVAIDPNFSSNGLIYLSYAEPGDRQTSARDVSDPRLGIYQNLNDAWLKGLAVARGRLDGVSLRDVQVIWRAEKTAGRGHFGGAMTFLPDGTLAFTSGDRQRFEPAQDQASGLGKIIRIRADGTVPPDNPFATSSGVTRTVWSYGHRNPLGIVVEAGSDRIWSNEMGPKGGDELNIIARGGNFGWPLVSPGDHYDDNKMPRPDSRPDFVSARHAWNPAISPAGLAVYEGDAIKPWKGDLVMGGLSSQSIVRVRTQGNSVAETETVRLGIRVRDVATAPDGSIWLLKDGNEGALMRLAPAN